MTIWYARHSSGDVFLEIYIPLQTLSPSMSSAPHNIPCKKVITFRWDNKYTRSPFSNHKYTGKATMSGISFCWLNTVTSFQGIPIAAEVFHEYTYYRVINHMEVTGDQ